MPIWFSTAMIWLLSAYVALLLIAFAGGWRPI
jgi:hypothetical protein